MFSIDHQIGRDDPMMPSRAAVRWSLHGKHDGFGAVDPEIAFAKLKTLAEGDAIASAKL